MVRRFRKLGLNQPTNPEYSLTFIKKLSNYGNMFQLYDEINGTNLGSFSENVLLSRGFSKHQLDDVRKHGTSNFIVEKKNKSYTMKKGKFKRICYDNWGRKRFKNPATGQIIVDNNGVLFSTSRDGEPEYPLKNQNQ
jgi:hypothetical protein